MKTGVVPKSYVTKSDPLRLHFFAPALRMPCQPRRYFPPAGALFLSIHFSSRPDSLDMKTKLAEYRERAAAGPAFLVWLFGGGLGLAVVVFVVWKMVGH